MAVETTAGEERDPEAVAAEAMAMGGLAYYEAVRDGRVAPDPFTVAMGFRIAEVRAGEVVLTATVGVPATSASGFAHGGWISALMDMATGMAVHTTLPPGRFSPHLEGSYRFFRPVLFESRVRCRAWTVNVGRSYAAARCELHDERDRLMATGESTNAIEVVR